MSEVESSIFISSFTIRKDVRHLVYVLKYENDPLVHPWGDAALIKLVFLEKGTRC